MALLTGLLDRAPYPLPAIDAAQDNAWIDDLAIDDEHRRILDEFFDGQTLTRFPNRQKKLLVILDYISTRFDASVTYTESEVNAVLRVHHDDVAHLRRYLVEFGYLRRERGGGTYWLPAE